MIKHSILFASVIAAFNAQAIEGGADASTATYPAFVKIAGSTGSSCTGTLVAGQWVLTAAHCGDGNFISTANGAVMIDKSTLHPSYNADANDGYDLAVWHVQTPISATQTAYLDSSELQAGTLYEIFGYALANTLKKAEMSGDNYSVGYPDRFRLLWESGVVGSGISQPGDSGGPAVSPSGRVVGVIHGVGSISQSVMFTEITTLARNSDFILEAINGWNAPTLVESTGKASIQVQNLHTQGEILAPWGDGLTIDLNDCGSVIAPFASCTLSVSGSGTLHLDSQQTVSVNPKSDGGNGGDSGSSGGGAMPLWSLLAMGLIGLVRRWRYGSGS